MAKKILVVDDSLTARRVVTEYLSSGEFTVIEAKDGQDGLDKLKEHQDVEVIISDINMPWVTGLEMVEKIKQDPRLSEIPICLLTTESSQESLLKAKNLGVNAFLVKPVQKDQLDLVLESFGLT